MKLFIFLGLGQWTFLSHQEQNLVHHVLQRCPIHHASGSYYCPVLQDLYLSEGKQKDRYSILIITLTIHRTIVCQELIRGRGREKLTTLCSALALLSV